MHKKKHALQPTLLLPIAFRDSLVPKPAISRLHGILFLRMKTRAKIGKLKAAQRKKIRAFKRNLERARRLVRKYVKPGASLADELIAERRGESRNSP
jgi:hypothetical protein